MDWIISSLLRGNFLGLPCNSAEYHPSLACSTLGIQNSKAVFRQLSPYGIFGGLVLSGAVEVGRKGTLRKRYQLVPEICVCVYQHLLNLPVLSLLSRWTETGLEERTGRQSLCDFHVPDMLNQCAWHSKNKHSFFRNRYCVTNPPHDPRITPNIWINFNPFHM